MMIFMFIYVIAVDSPKANCMKIYANESISLRTSLCVTSARRAANSGEMEITLHRYE